MTRIRRFWFLPAVTVFLSGCNMLSGCSSQTPCRGKFEPTEIVLAEVAGQNLMELTNPELVFVDCMGVKWIAPKGTWTDGATVPRLALPLTNGRFQREFLKAAIVHDAYCQDINKDRCHEQFHKRKWKQVHRMFYDACLAGDTSPSLAGLMFAAVWLGGPRWDDPGKELVQVPDELLQVSFRSCRAFIESENPNREEIENWMNKSEPALLALGEAQSRFKVALKSQDDAAADTALKDAEESIDLALSKTPNDLTLQNLRAYHYKIVGEAYQRERRAKDSDVELAKAADAFLKIISDQPNNANALTGMGDVSLLRNEVGDAEKYFLKSLETAPDDPFTKESLGRITNPEPRPPQPAK